MVWFWIISSNIFLPSSCTHKHSDGSYLNKTSFRYDSCVLLSYQYLALSQFYSLSVFQIPQVKGKVLWYELGTPISDATFLHSYRGGSYGTRCNLDYFSKSSMRWIMRGDTEIDGLYMAGQDAWTPAVAGAMYGGLLGSLKVF